MIPRKTTAWRLVGAAFAAAAALVAGMQTPGVAQQQTDSASRATRPASTPATTAASPKNDAPRDTKVKPWSLEDALPNNSKALGQPKAEASKGSGIGLGRVPLRAGQGSFGFETETKFKHNEMPDGRPIPGVATSAPKASQYLGLSLSVPTQDSSAPSPAPAAPAWSRPD